MNNSFFYYDIEENEKNAEILAQIRAYTTNQQFYVLNKPLGEKKYVYDYQDSALVLLAPKHKIIFIDLDNNTHDFENYIDEFIEDLGSISDKFGYRSYIGRPKKWKDEITSSLSFANANLSIAEILDRNKLENSENQRHCELLISLLTGSINNIDKVKATVPNNILDKVKQKIVLFDGDQTRFIYQKNTQHKITIQGLSGTGKTELLLHKLKEIYTDSKDSKIMFTCFNKILASNLRQRIPDFFTFMKVEEQISWNERLWMVNAWGSRANIHSGAYRYICHFYGIDFYTYSFSTSFDRACQLAIADLENISSENFEYAFDYMLIDESQDFPESFFNLCEKVTKNTVYVAGDIFQNIFDTNLENSTSVDFLLSRCYRTDPRTLMFAHAVGMGLYETPKLNWLEDDQWNACGYLVVKDNRNYQLRREALRRFEDLETEKVKSMNLVKCNTNYIASIEAEVIKTIQGLIDSNTTLCPDDVAVIFLDDNNDMYTLADNLKRSIKDQFGWETNKAYETKVKKQNELFLSNKNNVKGLEFPFVICIVKTLRDELKFRNALYMMLTRSFIQSYLIINDDEKVTLIEEGLEDINQNGCIKTIEPTEEEKKQIQSTIIKYREDMNVPYKDFINKIFDECKIDSKNRKRLEQMLISTGLENNFDKALVIDFIEANKKYLIG